MEHTSAFPHQLHDAELALCVRLVFHSIYTSGCCAPFGLEDMPASADCCSSSEIRLMTRWSPSGLQQFNWKPARANVWDEHRWWKQSGMHARHLPRSHLDIFAAELWSDNRFGLKPKRFNLLRRVTSRAEPGRRAGSFNPCFLSYVDMDTKMKGKHWQDVEARRRRLSAPIAAQSPG